MRARHIMALLLVWIPVMTHAGGDGYHDFREEQLRYGKAVWLLNCETCHAYGVADAPVPMNPEEWEMRLKQEKSVLYDHAINGYFGPDDSMMPPRGGNPKLSDNDVRAAVDYMAALASYYINQARNPK